MHYLKEEVKDFEQAMKEVLFEGGDTDTSVCIGGAVIEAAIGVDSLPKSGFLS